MSDQNKLAILRVLSENAKLGEVTRMGFHTLSKTVDLSKEELDPLLVQLNKDRFISQYAKKGVDGFTLVLNQKGLDAVEDESFI